MNSSFFKLAILSILIASCSDKPQYNNIDSQLEPYVTDALEIIKRAGGKIKADLINVNFTNRLQNHPDPRYRTVIASADGMNRNGIVEIVVNPAIWSKLDHTQKRWVMVHELLHDMFNMKHFSTLFLDPSIGADMDKEKFEASIKSLEMYFGFYPDGLILR
jgi:hypothetical protein